MCARSAVVFPETHTMDCLFTLWQHCAAAWWSLQWVPHLTDLEGTIASTDTML